MASSVVSGRFAVEGLDNALQAAHFSRTLTNDQRNDRKRTKVFIKVLSRFFPSGRPDSNRRPSPWQLVLRMMRTSTNERD